MSSGLTYGSVCSGIGGLDLGFDRQGFRCLWQCEIDPYAQSILRRHWNVPLYDDIRKIGREREHQAERPDVLIGGFPCQDVSTANPNATGLQGERSGPIFHEIVRLTREFRPRYVVLENVSALTHRGLEEVLAEFHLCGYDVRWDIVSAASVGAEHRRDRIFIIAIERETVPDTESDGLLHGSIAEQPDKRGLDALCNASSGSSDVSNTQSKRGRPRTGRIEEQLTQCSAQLSGRNDSGDVQNSKLFYGGRKAEVKWILSGKTKRDSGGPIQMQLETQILAEDLRSQGYSAENLPDQISGYLNPDWVELLMGFPPGWTKSGLGKEERHALLEEVRTDLTASDASVTQSYLRWLSMSQSASENITNDGGAQYE